MTNKVALKEYLERREERLQLEELDDNFVYALYIRLVEGSIDAIRMPASAEVAAKVGANVVELTALDEDFNKMFDIQGIMEDGLWHALATRPLTFKYHGQVIPADESYLLDYDEGMDMPTVEAAQSIRSPEELAGRF